jgi:hypothetical protein
MHPILTAARSGVVDLNHTGHYLHWGVIQISWANAVVILLMLLVFVLALVIPFHGRGQEIEPQRSVIPEAREAGTR